MLLLLERDKKARCLRLLLLLQLPCGAPLLGLLLLRGMHRALGLHGLDSRQYPSCLFLSQSPF